MVDRACMAPSLRYGRCPAAPPRGTASSAPSWLEATTRGGVPTWTPCACRQLVDDSCCPERDDRLMTDTAPRLPLPATLVAAAEAEGRTGWLVTLPGTVARLVREWSLAVEAPFTPGGTDRVGGAGARPDRRRTGAEGRLAASGSRARGRWAARLGRPRRCSAARRRAHAETRARCCSSVVGPGTPLAMVMEPEQDRVVAVLAAPAVDRAAGRIRLPSVAGHVRPLGGRVRPSGLPPSRTGRTWGWRARAWRCSGASPPTPTGRVLLVTDLHAGNVLAAEREPWLVIDPKPYVGDPAYERGPSTCSTAPSGCTLTRPAWRTEWPICSLWTGCACAVGCSRGACRSPPGDLPLADVARRLPLD